MEIKKGIDILSIIYVIIVVVVIGIFFLIMSKINTNLYSAFDTALENNPQFNQTEAHYALKDAKDADQKVWDFAFLGLAIGYLFILGISAYSTRISPVFYWIFIVLSFIFILIAVILANIWQKIAESPAFSDVIGNYPITNTMLGTYYPIIIAVFIIFGFVLAMGKPTENGSEI